MNGQINQLVRSLLQKDSLEQCSLQELEQFANRHPYFGAAQLLLTKKMQLERSAQYDEQLQKTFLFFHNPLWVEQLLNDTGNATITHAEKKEPIAAAEAISEMEPIAETKESEIVITTQSTTTEIGTENDVVVEPVPEVQSIEEEMVALTNDKESEPVADPVDPIETVVTEQPAAPIPDEIKTEVKSTNDDVLLFEPYHTVDYFASQGIKIREDEKPTDKFGKQLRSFTDWLKTMKRLQVSEISAAVEPVAEQKVEQLAAHSLEEREVVTEAMAEVWEKQGNSLKAIDIYIKLSLLEPSKSAYFAAKIEELKKLN